MTATVTVKVDLEQAKEMLKLSGHLVNHLDCQSICELAIKQNFSYGVETIDINWEEER